MIHTFDTPTQYLAFLSRPPAQGAGTNSSRQGHGEWAGTSTWEEAIALASRGDPEGCAQVAAITDRLRDLAAEMPPSEALAPAVVGPYLDVGKYVDGDPECFLARQTREMAPVRICVEGGMSGQASAQAIRVRGAAVAALVHLLEDAGRQVEVWTSTCFADSFNGTTTDTPQGAAAFLRVKDASALPEGDALAYWLTHPAVFRRLAFRYLENVGTPWAIRETRDCYAYPGRVARDHWPVAFDWFYEFDPAHNRWRTADDAVPVVRQAFLSLTRPTPVP